DGIRALIVTGVQTCALPIYRAARPNQGKEMRKSTRRAERPPRRLPSDHGCAPLPNDHIGTCVRPSSAAIGAIVVGCDSDWAAKEIGRASCRERGEVGESEGG